MPKMVKNAPNNKFYIRIMAVKIVIEHDGIRATGEDAVSEFRGANV